MTQGEFDLFIGWLNNQPRDTVNKYIKCFNRPIEQADWLIQAAFTWYNTDAMGVDWSRVNDEWRGVLDDYRRTR
jgi:hypothetical protein